MQASSCGTWPCAVSSSGSIDRSTILHAVGRREGSVSYVGKSSWAGHDWRRQGLFREGLREVEGHWVWATGSLGSESLIPHGDALHAQATVSNHCAAEEDLLEQPRSRQTPKEVPILCLVTEKSQATSTLKITTNENHFLACEIARTSNERNKVALQVKCSWKRNKPKVMSTQRILTAIYSWPTNWQWCCTSKRLEVSTNYSTGPLLSI